MFLISGAMNRWSCNQAWQYKRQGSFCHFPREMSSVPNLFASLRYITISRVRGLTISAHCWGCGSWRLFGGGSWKGWLLMGICCFNYCLHKQSSLLDLQKLICIFVFYHLLKKEWGTWVRNSLQRCLCLLSSVAEGQHMWVWIQILVFCPFVHEKHTIVSSSILMVTSRTGWGNQALPQFCQHLPNLCARAQREKH